MIIDGIAASQAVDSSGESLNIEGCDISTLPVDGVINYEHLGEDSVKKDRVAPGEEIVGRILVAKKVFKLDDCETDRERMYWNDVKVPFVYMIARLADGAGHRGAQALAASIRDHYANGEEILLRWSIEGSTLHREGNELMESVARRVSITWKPCNRTAVSGLIEDPRAPEGFEKKPGKEKDTVDLLAGLVEKNEEFEHPAFMKLGGIVETKYVPFGKSEDEVEHQLRIIIKDRMAKALTAGGYGAAPGSLTGGSALQVEDRSLRGRMKRAVRDYKSERFDKAEFKVFAKKLLPECDDSFLDHFADVAEDYHMRRGSMKKAEELAKKSWIKKPKKPKAVASPASTEPEGPELADEPEHATDDQLDFPTDFAPADAAPAPPAKGKVKAPKKPVGLPPAAGDELREAYQRAQRTFFSPKTRQHEVRGLQPITVGNTTLNGKALANYLGMTEPPREPLTIRGKPVQGPRPSKHVDADGVEREYTAEQPHFNPQTGYLNVPATEATFNMKKGKWQPGHAGGYFKMYIPGHYDPALHGPDAEAGQKQAAKEHEDFVKLLDDPERSKYHDSAMANWVLAHRLMRQGKTPEEMVAHMTAFSQLSPNTPVPVHEMMFSYLQDTLKHTGIDMRDPKFAGARGHLLSADLKAARDSHGKKRPNLNDPEQYGVYGDWKARDTGDPNKLPEHAPEHSKRTIHNITIGNDQNAKSVKPGMEPRKKGQLASFMLAQNKFVNMAKYHHHHQQFHALFGQHGPQDLGDQAIVNHLMQHKVEGGKFEAAKDRAVKGNKTEFKYGGQTYPINAEYPEVNVEGLAPKTSRLAVTMSGGGSMHVPDTHMTRYNFGLEKGRGGGTDEEDDTEDQSEPTEGAVGQGPKDNETIAALKRVLWEERNHHILNGMDRYYEKHSPAVDHMVDRWGHWLDGETPEEKRRHAVFGGFWKNWSAIVDHEKSRGYWSTGKNDYSDHRPAWEAVAPSSIGSFPIAPFLVMPKLTKGEEGYDESLPFRTATLHAHWCNRHGEMNGHYMFMRYLMPHLLAAHAVRASTMQKYEAEIIDLKKSVSEAVAEQSNGDPDYQMKPVSFRGHSVIPGSAFTSKGKYALLHEDGTHFYAVPHEHVYNHDVEHLVRLPKAKQGTHFWLISRPAVLASDLET